MGSWCAFDLAALDREVEELQAAAAAPDLWDDAERGRRVMRRLTGLQTDLGQWRSLRSRVGEALALAEMVDPEVDRPMAQELEHELAALTEDLDRAERQLWLSGDYDDHDALLAVHAGAGGTESQDWAAMLLRMYMRWADEHGFQTELIDSTPGEEAGIKSATLTFSGRHAYGLLRSERGVHRLVRISPFDSAARRHTSFVLVEVSPVIDDDVEIDLDERDVRMDVFRASGAGGQHVNKTSSAVRLTHEPTGIVVTCQNERSQAQNRATAMRILRARLLEAELERREAEQARLKGEHVEAGWGNQIRSYVLQPYQMVKDHRTSFETGRTQAVLDGDIDEIIESYLRHKVGATA
jgi:peptide chain release factor 2